MTAQRPWIRILAEGVVIVVSILLALAADAWWDERTERADEQIALRQLLADFEDNAIELATVIAGHQRAQEAAGVLIEVAQRSTELETDSLRRLVRELDQAWTFNPKLGALESLIAAGRLGIIQDDSLRFELAAFRGIVDDYVEEEVSLRDHVANAQHDYFSAVVNWNDVWGPARNRTDRTLTHLAGDERLESVAGYRWGFEGGILMDAEQAQNAVDRVLSLLDRSLEPSGRQ